MNLAPLAIVVPILTAAVLVGIGERVSRVVANVTALVAAAATTTLCALLLAHVWHGTDVAWMGGWHPRHGGVALGIDLAVDPLGAGAATFVSALLTAALVYSQRYFDAVAPMFHGLMLVFLAGMVGFCLTGDLFNMFVFFELMTVPAIALTAYKKEEGGPLQGALAFAVVNTVGAVLVLTGIALLYGRTGALNLAQIGEALAGHRADGLTIAAFGFAGAGLLVKAGAVPFHFWLPDAYAVAPIPVCVLFASIMGELALLGLARVYWTVFSGVDGLASAVSPVLLGVGVVTALVGGLMTFEQHHAKRMLAFSTISHIGMFLVGIAALGAHALGAVAMYVLAHGATKGSLFMATGFLGHRLGTVSERDLHGRAGGRWLAGIVFLLGGLALASIPPSGMFAAKALLEEAATAHGWAAIPYIFVVVGALTGGAVLRFAARAFLGLGRPAPGDPSGTELDAGDEDRETEGGRHWTPATFVVPTVVLLATGLILVAIPEVRHAIDRAAALFVDRQAYVGTVLHGQPAPVPDSPPATGPHTSSYLFAIATVAGALAAAAGALFAPRPGRGPAGALLRRPGDLLRAWHTGHLGDAVTWAVVGAAIVGWTVALGAR